jgi:phosphohistidine phosphatase SixA
VGALVAVATGAVLIAQPQLMERILRAVLPEGKMLARLVSVGHGITDGLAGLRSPARLAGVIFWSLALWLVSAASTTTVFVMRHAEKLTSNPDDPDPTLAPAGEARALELAQFFGRAPKGQPLNAVVVSEFRRTQDTVRPLANRLGIPVIVVPAEDTSVTAKRALSENRGGRVLIVGHSDTVPEIVQELSGIDVGPMSEADYGIVYLVTIPRFSRAAVTRLDLP